MHNKVVYMREITEIPVRELKPHEDVDEKRLREVLRSLIRERVLKNAILVDRDTKVILDGHHRVKSFEILGMREIPGVLVDYTSNDIKLRSRTGEEISKETVLRVGRSPNVFPYKTTKHIFPEESSLKVEYRVGDLRSEKEISD